MKIRASHKKYRSGVKKDVIAIVHNFLSSIIEKNRYKSINALIKRCIEISFISPIID